MNSNIILIGFMGCGKTSVGERIAQHMGYTFADTDHMIEQDTGMEISTIFSEKGEEYFRDLETETIRKLADKGDKMVISTGGGLPMRECNARILNKLGFVVYLKAAKDTVLARLAGDASRPLLAGGNAEEKVGRLLDYREPMYEAAAHLIAETDGRTFEEIIGEIVRNYEIIIKPQTE